jgi:uncharacterized membrane protein YbhN (UPF0104 family)
MDATTTATQAARRSPSGPAARGVLDGGLAAALVLYHVPADQVAAAVLVYHAIALWLPGLGGLVAYAGLRRRLVRSAAAD